MKQKSGSKRSISKAALKITLTYLCTGFFWIIFSDRLVEVLVGQSEGFSELFTSLQTYKGLFYVTVTGCLLYYLINRHDKKVAIAEEALRQSEERLDLALKGANEGAWDWDVAAGKVIYTESWAQMMGYRLDEIDHDRSFSQKLIHPDDLPCLTESISRQMQAKGGKFESELRMKTKDGHWKWLLSRGRVAKWDENGHALRVAGTHRDITERKRAEEEIAKFKTIADNATYGVGIADLGGNFIYVNQALAATHGYRVNELMGQHYSQLHAQREVTNLPKMTAESLQSGCFSGVEYWHQRKDESIFPTMINAMVIKDSQGRPGYIAIQVSDITELKRLQEQSVRAQRLETAGQIAGQVAHDFNNLLGPIVAYPDLIRAELAADSALVPLLNDIQKSAEQIAEINQDLLTLGRRGHYVQKPLDLNNLINQVMSYGDIEANEVEIDLKLERQLLNIRGGASQLGRAITNLIINSYDSMKNGGQLTIRTENCYIESLIGRFGVIPKGEYVKLVIADTGVGIPEDIVNRIFDPFFTTKTTDKRRGSGLGLSVVDAVIKDHHGYIDVQTRLNQGTTFSIYLPITRDKPEEGSSDKLTGGNEKILIADDDAIQRDVINNLLTRLGYRVAAVSSGEKALSRLRQDSFDLVILDMVMPPGIDGTETYRQALMFNPEQRALLLSGFAEGKRVAEGLDLGIGAFLRKPLTMQTLAQAVRAELDKKAPVVSV